MAAPELYAPHRPAVGRMRAGPDRDDAIAERPVRGTAEAARRRGLVYRAMTSAVALSVVGGFSYYAWSAYSGERGPTAADGEVAMIRAAVEPIKHPPENPGGIAAAGSGYEFFETVNGQPLTLRPDEEFVLPPPESPITDPMPELFDRPPPVPLELVEPADSSPGSGAAEASIADLVGRATAGAGVSVPPVLSTPMLPLPVVDQQQLTAQPAGQLLDAGASAVADTPTQSAIDTLVAAVEAGLAEGAQAAPQPLAVAPASGAVATVQLASMLSQEQADQEWARLRRLMPDLLGNSEPIIRTSASGDRTYYRVSVGAASAIDAAALCAEIKNRGRDCIVHD